MADRARPTVQDLGLKLLLLINARTERFDAPVIATDLVSELGEDPSDVKAAFRYLADKGWIKTYSLDYAARINAAGQDEILAAANRNVAAELDSAAEAAIREAFKEIISQGGRAYRQNTPMVAEKILMRECQGRCTTAEAAERIKRAISAMVAKGALEAPAEQRFDWRFIDISAGGNEMASIKPSHVRGKIFIGHGGSPVWLEVEKFLRDRLNVPCDEFNSGGSAAGFTTVERIQQMLNDASFAFLVMTAEDETSDGRKVARMNVIHEVGLFQGRLGFKKAIVLLAEDCEEFSNITGLGQIRFPPGKVSGAFEKIREVLEREGIIAAV
jgi:predicted nucleotide-binding protein